jgi:hypothetical protein
LTKSFGVSNFIDQPCVVCIHVSVLSVEVEAVAVAVVVAVACAGPGAVECATGILYLPRLWGIVGSSAAFVWW